MSDDLLLSDEEITKHELPDGDYDITGLLQAQLAKVFKHKETTCYYCDEKADAAMLVMGNSIAHDTCVIQKLNELLDPDLEGRGEPSKIVGDPGDPVRLFLDEAPAIQESQE